MECGQAIDILRSCYSTTFLLPDGTTTEGTWWFEPEGTPLAGHSTAGSLNWSRPHFPAQGPGEVQGAKRYYANGSRPANACGDGVGTSCSDRKLPLTMWAHWYTPDNQLSFPINYDSNSGQWTGDSQGLTLPTGQLCGYFYAAFMCVPSAGTWDVQARAGGYLGGTTYFDQAGSVVGPPDQEVEASCPLNNISGICSGHGYAPTWVLVVNETAPGRRALPLV